MQGSRQPKNDYGTAICFETAGVIKSVFSCFKNVWNLRGGNQLIAEIGVGKRRSN